MKNLPLVLGVLALAFALYLAFANFGGLPIALAGFGAPVNLPSGAVVLIGYACGLITIGTAWAAMAKREVRGEQKKIEWAQQDAKLAVEVESDRVKQLEAKIATLETALKNVLKKKES